MALIGLDAYGDAERLLRGVLEARETLYAGPHPRTVETLARLGIVLRRQHRTSDAVDVLARGLAMAEALHDSMHPNVGMMLSNLGLAHVEAHDIDAAVPELERALAIYRASEGEYGPRVAVLEFQLGEALRGAGRLDEAEPHLERARAIESELYGPDDPRTIATAHAVAGLLLDRGEWAAAEKKMRECLAACDRAGPGGAHLKPDLLTNLGHALYRQGRLEEARDSTEASLALTQEDRSAFYANRQHGLGMILFDLGDYEAAVAALEIAVAVRTEVGDPMLPESQELLERAKQKQR
jgi:tetratricopeptide (TPR) repeat protein